MTDNGAHIELHQQEGTPAVLVGIVGNTISGGGESGAAVSLSGLGATRRRQHDRRTRPTRAWCWRTCRAGC